LMTLPAVLFARSEVRRRAKGLPLVEATVRLPLILRRSQFVPAVPVALLISQTREPPELKTVAPVLRVPGEAPGETVPPELTVRAPREPVPERVPPESTEKVEAEAEPVRASWPPVMAVAPE